MVWTRLAYLSLPSAFVPQKIGSKWIGAEVGARYRNVLRKEFLKAGVPWEYDPIKFKKPNSKHPFQKPPKLSKKYEIKAIRIAKITKALSRQDELQLKYRQETANKKRLTGIDHFIASTLGNYLKDK
jgi:hypothetical protein